MKSQKLLDWVRNYFEMNGLPSWTMEGVDHAPPFVCVFCLHIMVPCVLSSFPLWCEINSLSKFGIDELQTLEQLT